MKTTAEEIHEELHVLMLVAREANVVMGQELVILPCTFGEFVLAAHKAGITIVQLTKLFENVQHTAGSPEEPQKKEDTDGT